jgi:long-chain acyl-CoA synthetase
MAKVADDMLPLQRLYHWERTLADKVYLTQPMGGSALREFTWRQAMDEARRMATHLQSFGWEPGTRIAILSKNCAWWLMSDYAIWLAGYVSVPIYPTLAATTVRQILDHSEAKAVFVGKLDEWDMMKPGVPDGIQRIRYCLSPKEDYPCWDDIIAKTAPLQGQPLRPAEDLATIIYTSGTTGTPKGVMHPFASFAHAATVSMQMFDGNENDRVLSYLPLAHVADRLVAEVASLRTGCHVYFAESLDTFQQDLQRARPTIFMSVPRLWMKFQQNIFAAKSKQQLDKLFRIPILGRIVKKKILQQLGLEHVRIALSGAAPLPAESLAWFRSLGLELVEAYGMTENFAVSHCCQPGDVRPGYVGQPWQGVDVKFADNGEILVRSPANMLGYFKDEEKTRESFTDDGYFLTGDVGEVDEKGRLKITGRAKEQFKTSKGKYVAPAPIENLLGAHPKIEASCVTGVSFPQPFALVMLNAIEFKRVNADTQARDELTASLKQHLEAINEKLDPHEQLMFMAVVREQWTEAAGFVTPTFKVKRALIEKHYEPMYGQWAKQKQPVVWQ